MITLVAILCHGLLCTDVEIPTPQMAAGKVDDPHPMAFTIELCRAQGQQIVSGWQADPLNQYHNWQLVDWKCVPGSYVPSQRASLEEQRAALVQPKKKPPVTNFNEAYRALHDQQGDKKLPDWCAVTTEGGRESEDPTDHGVGLDHYCRVRNL